jgi:ubiquinone biosynthesis protein
VKAPLGSLSRTYRHIHRYREIVGTLIKYGFQDVVEQLNIRYYLELGKSVLMQRPAEHIAGVPRAARARMIIEELGTTFIKFGQIMSTRPDVMPADLIHELKKLQDRVPPYPTEQAVRLIEQELEAPLDKLFAAFDRTPIASASIAQVYRARLPDGTDVAVKVQRPDIQKTVEVDIEIMQTLARLAEAHLEGMATLQPTAVVEEFARVIENEMNFHIEARNIERFIEQFAGNEQVRAPRVFRDWCTRRVLTLEFIHGTKISDTEDLRAQGIDAATIAHIGADAVLQQVFEFGFFHGDPHPGNLVVTAPTQVCFLDFGMMGRLDRRMQEDLAALLVCIVRRDDETLTRTVLRIATNADDITETDKLTRALADFVDRHAYLPLDKLNVGEVLQDMLDLLLGFQLKLPPEIYLLIKALVTIEGVGRALDPSFVFLQYVEPYVVRLVKHRHDPRRMAADAGRTALDFYHLLRDLPGEARSLLKFLRKGELKVNLETRSMEPVMKTWDRDANRLSFAIVIASLLVSSAIIVLSHVPPLWHNISVLGVVGFGLSVVMSLWLLIAIFTSGHMS